MYVVKDETLNICATILSYRDAVCALDAISHSGHDVAMYRLTEKGFQLIDSDKHTSRIAQDVGPTIGVMR